MEFGDRSIVVGDLNAEQTVALIKFVHRVLSEVSEDSAALAKEGILKGRIGAFINILSPIHLVELTAILTGLPKQFVKENWSFSRFTEVLAELMDSGAFGEIVKNLRQVSDFFQSLAP